MYMSVRGDYAKFTILMYSANVFFDSFCQLGRVASLGVHVLQELSMIHRLLFFVYRRRWIIFLVVC